MKLVALYLSLILPSLLVAQTKISGKVSNAKGKPLAGVSVTLVNTYDGATTDAAGNFTFETVERGAQKVEATLNNFKTDARGVFLKDTAVILNFILKPLVTELEAVVITAGSFEASDRKKGAVLTPIDIVTTASANGDITSALNSLPGTQQVGESEGLFVRGGTATEAKIYIDGNLVNNFFYSATPGIATRGRFNPFLFKGTVFSTGGYSALYGQALSSALVLESVDLPERSSADASISVVGVGGGIQQLAKNKKSSYGFSVNYTNLILGFALNKQKQDYFTIPEFTEGDANFRIKTKRGGFLKYFGYFATSRVGFRQEDIDSANLKNAFSLNNGNMYHNLNLKERLNNNWKLQIGLSLSTNKDDITNELQDASNIKTTFASPAFYQFKNFDVVNKALYAQARVVLEKKLKGLSALRFGSDYFYSNEKTVFYQNNGTSTTEKVTDNLKALFAETDLYLSNNIALKLGGRLEHSQIINKVNVAPRASLAYKLGGNLQASIAYGIFYQNPERRILPTASTLNYSKASHYIFQLLKQSKDYTFRTELFYKNYDNLYKTGVVNFREVALNNNGFGSAKGFELFWRDKKTIKNVDYWISYSYLDTKRDFLNFPSAIQPNFAANHTAAFVFKRFVTEWKTGFNFSYNFATGRPYYRIENNNGNYTFTDMGKTRPFNSMSVSVNYLPNLGKKNAKAFSVFVLGISNVLGNTQVFNYNYNNSGTKKVAVTNPSKRFAFIGAFLSFGIDRTENAINNNL
jgi:vitamin B12 transporter